MLPPGAVVILRPIAGGKVLIETKSIFKKVTLPKILLAAAQPEIAGARDLSHHYWRWLRVREFAYNHRHAISLIAGLTLLRMIYIQFISITPQEAYYWYYSLKPDLSYFDHPPLTAYSILLGTWLFGKSIFAVKFMAVIWSMLSNGLLYLTTLRAASRLRVPQARQSALMAVILFNLTIFAHLYAILMVPDAPLLFFWMLTIYLIQEFILDGKTGHLLLAGLIFGLGLTAKFTILALLPALFLALLLDRQRRAVFRRMHPYLAILLALLAFSPVIIWNITHDWASFQFQFGSRLSEVRPIQSKYILQLIASQVFMLTPLLFALCFGKLFTGWRNANGICGERLLYLSALFIIGGFIVYSSTQLVKMNWLLPGYLGLIILIALGGSPRDFFRKKIVRIGTGFSIMLILLAHGLLLVPNIPLGEGNTWSGWRNAAAQVQQQQAAHGGKNNCFIFTNSYKSASLLRFYLPEEQVVYSRNIYGEPALQFDIWGIPDSLVGMSAIYVHGNRREYKPDLPKIIPYFQAISPLKIFRYTFQESIETRSIHSYYLENYRPAAGKQKANN